MNWDLERGMRDLDLAEAGFLAPRCGEHLVREWYKERKKIGFRMCSLLPTISPLISAIARSSDLSVCSIASLLLVLFDRIWQKVATAQVPILAKRVEGDLPPISWTPV
jgi:hypothetical protein